MTSTVPGIQVMFTAIARSKQVQFSDGVICSGKSFVQAFWLSHLTNAISVPFNTQHTAV